VTRGTLGAGERFARSLRPEASHRDAGNDQLVRGHQCRRERCRIELGEGKLGLIELPDQEKATNFEIPRMRGVHAVAVLFERRARHVKRLCRPAQVPGDERDLGFCDDASRTRHGILRTERTSRTPQENLRSNEIADLRHCNSSKRKSRRVVAQRDPLQRAERITRCECARRGSDQRVHRNPVTLVTPTV
jgi:hypothetical protein